MAARAIPAVLEWQNRTMKSILESMKFSANVPEDVLAFLDQQVEQGHFASRSAALTEAITLWRVHRLAPMYAEAFSDVTSEWDATVADGLSGDGAL